MDKIELPYSNEFLSKLEERQSSDSEEHFRFAEKIYKILEQSQEWGNTPGTMKLQIALAMRMIGISDE